MLRFVKHGFSHCMQLTRQVHTSAPCNIFYKKARKRLQEGKEKEEAISKKFNNDIFDQSEARLKKSGISALKNREIFEDAIFIYEQRYGKMKRGHCEFIYSALERIEEYGLHEDIDTYRKLFEIFPKDVMVVQSLWQIELNHYPKQQDCAVYILSKMEHHGVIPDDKMGRQIMSIFGFGTHPLNRFQRMTYWLPKLHNSNPWPYPRILPADERKVAIMALRRICPDPLNKVSLYEVDTDSPLGKTTTTFVASAQSPKQQQLLIDLVTKSSEHYRPIAEVSGPYNLWFNKRHLRYFTLTCKPDSDHLEQYRHWKQEQEDAEDDFTSDSFNWRTCFGEDDTEASSVLVPPSIHEQEESTILGISILGRETYSCLRAWIVSLEENNPSLTDVTVSFKLLDKLSDEPGSELEPASDIRANGRQS